MAAQAYPGNRYDAHTLMATLDQLERTVGQRVRQLFVGGGCRGPDTKEKLKCTWIGIEETRSPSGFGNG